MSTRIRLAGLFILLCVAAVLAERPAEPQRSAQDYEPLRETAERLYRSGSYALALKQYETARRLELAPEAARWVEFRLADCAWRSEASTQTNDTSKLDAARVKLEQLVAAIEREPDRDLVWGEAQESLADHWWTRRDLQNWGRAWQHYERALEFWAGSTDIETARERYVEIVRTMARPAWRGRQHHYGQSGHVPMAVLDDAIRIASDEDRPYLYYLLTQAIHYQGGTWRQRMRIIDAFENAIAGGRENEWYDDALFAFGQWLESRGRVVRLGNGQWRQEPDFKRAIEVYQRIMREFRRGESQFIDDAKARIEGITAPALGATVSNVFMPGSEIQLQLSWRNLARVDLAITPVDLVDHVAFRPDRLADRGPGQWADHIDTRNLRPLRTWTLETGDDGQHRPGQRAETLEEPLPVGAYVLTATAGKLSARELILVTDATVVIKTDPDKNLVLCCDAVTGAPLAGATVRLWSLWSKSHRQWAVRERTVQTNDQGLCEISTDELGSAGVVATVMVAVKSGEREAVATTNTSTRSTSHWPWKLYTFTDRPAYRPGETAQWKVTGRRSDGQATVTPSGESIAWEIRGPQGARIGEGESALNEFGSAWGDLELTADMMLGEYTMVFYKTPAKRSQIGSSRFFRLEEYKLPEFKVAIATPRDERGRRKAFRVGDTVEAQITAEYYFGGPVANATVEAVIYQKPYYQWWQPRREYSWCYEPQPNRWGYGHGQVIDRRTLKTDETGQVTVRFDTPEYAQQDFEYRIEARVTDASRREIVGSDAVRVTQRLYSIYPRPRSNLYAPGDRVEIDVKTLDANEEPVRVRGEMTVYRDEWKEIWVDAMGREPAAPEQRRLAADPAAATAAGFRVKFRGYASEKLASSTLQTDDAGEAVFRFVPDTDGYYRFEWRSPDTLDEDDSWFGDWITASTMVWVLDDRSRAIGYRHGGVDLVIDRDTVKVGEHAAVMVATPTNDRWVLFTVEGESLHDHRMIHVPGQVRLVHLPVREVHVPNVTLAATMVSRGALFIDAEPIVVPPVEQYLEITVSADREAYEPQETGLLTVTALDHLGKPVSAEIALSLFDESVTYIQDDYAGDPRAFFFGQRQRQLVRTGSTFQYRPYVSLVTGADGQLTDVKLDEIRKREGARGDFNEFDNGLADGRLNAPMEAQEGMAMSEKSAAGMPSRQSKLGMDDAMPAAAPAPGAGAPDSPDEPVKMRTDFRSTLLWLPDVVTDASGRATVEVRYADSLTGWKAVARGGTTLNQFGIGTTRTRTRKPLMARLQAPRFFVVGDTVTISAVLNNNTDEPLETETTLAAPGLKLLGVKRDGRLDGNATGRVTVPAGGDARVDWLVEVRTPGEVEMQLTTRAGRYTDGMVKSFPIHDHGIEKLLATSGKVRGDDLTLRLEIPTQRRVESTELTVQVTPSMAVTMLDALPYLIDYPYGCTEQTMSRFLPAAITAKTLQDLGLDPDTAMGRVFGGIDPETARKSHPKGRRHLAELDAMIDAGLERLRDFQHADGGWGWWKNGRSDRFMTAYVLWGLSIAVETDLEVDGESLARAARFLESELIEEEFNPEIQAWMLHALSAHHRATGQAAPGKSERHAFENLFSRRDGLNAYARSLLALSAHRFGRAREAKILVDNLANGVKLDERPDSSIIVRRGKQSNPAVIGTAHWGSDGVWWRWSDGPVETTSFALQALLAIDPGNALVEPVTNWLVKNRRGSHWSNTRDTAIVVMVMNDYLKTSGELKGDLAYELSVNGQVIDKRTIAPRDVLAAPSRFTIDPAVIRNGPNDIRIRRSRGEGPLYVSAEARFFSLEEPIPAAGNEIFVRRDYHRLVPTATLLKGYESRRQHMADEDYVTSGERVEVIITVESKNDYEYLILEDLKPAGLEAVALQSGSPIHARELRADAANRAFAHARGSLAPADHADATGDRSDYTGRQVWMHQELRDRHVAFFIDRLPQGIWEIRYELRAEVPGHYHALPVLGHAMYVPEIRCNGDEIRMTVNE